MPARDREARPEPSPAAEPVRRAEAAPTGPGASGPGSVLRMQRTLGNSHVQRVLARPIGGDVVVQRWEGEEHLRLGDRSGGAETGFMTLDAHARDLPQRGEPPERWPDPWKELYRKGSPDQRRMLRQGLSYGEIVALAGDLYAGIGELQTAPLREVYDLLPLIHTRTRDTAPFEAATGGRYLALAQDNERHFSNVAPGKSNLETWRTLHLQAIQAAQAGDANQAWALNAFGDHYLTDAFAGGHIRTPRSELTGGLGQFKSRMLHNLDNRFGVDVVNERGDEWTAFGDDQLERADGGNERNLQLAGEAVRLSKQEVADALAGGKRYRLPARFAAEALVPTDAGKGDRWTGRNPTFIRTPDGRFIPRRNDWNEMERHVIFDEGPEVAKGLPATDDHVREWVGKHTPAALAQQPLREKLRMISTVLSPVVSGEDVDAVKKLWESTPPGERRAVARRIREGIRAIGSEELRSEVKRMIGLRDEPRPENRHAVPF